MAIRADYIELNRTTLIEPQKRALNGLSPAISTSKLVLKDVCLEDPARGTLFTQYDEHNLNKNEKSNNINVAVLLEK